MVKRRHGVASKRISRNKKTYWRKGADVSAVEAFAESVRVDEILGGNATEKSDTDLYFIQKQPVVDKKSNEIVRCLKKIELKCFRNLKSDSATKVLTRQIPSMKKLQKKRENQLKKSIKKLKPLGKNSPENNIYDLWEEDCKKPTTSLDADQEDYYLRQTKKRLPNIPKSKSQIVTKLSKIELPHPGQSYNPTFVDHQDLLKQAIIDEKKKNKKEQKIERQLDITGEIATEASKSAELREGLDLLKKEDSDEDSSNDEENVEKSFEIAPINSENRKLTIQRAKENAEKIKKSMKIDDKMNKKRLNDIYRLRSIKNEIKQQDEKSLKKQQKKKQLKEEKMFKPAILSRHKYEPPELELNLSTEICGSLRQMKPEGNILEDRYKSLQRRNIVEPRIFFMGQKRKYRKKKFEKRDCKEVTVDYVPRH